MTNDTISRQAAINEIRKCRFVVEAIEKIRGLPSSDRPQGKWIDNGDRYYRCSLCGTRDTDTWDWCHGCGCRMKGADDE